MQALAFSQPDGTDMRQTPWRSASLWLSVSFTIPASLARWIPTTSMLLVSLISYIDRNTLALLIPTIMKETHLSAEQYGFIVSAFSIAYMISNPLWGSLLDRMGLRIGMLVAVSFWTAASMSHALAAGFLSFAIARTALGFGEGATFPGGLRAVVQTLRPTEQARGIAVAYSGGSLGAIPTSERSVSRRSG